MFRLLSLCHTGRKMSLLTFSQKSYTVGIVEHCREWRATVHCSYIMGRLPIAQEQSSTVVFVYSWNTVAKCLLGSLIAIADLYSTGQCEGENHITIVDSVTSLSGKTWRWHQSSLGISRNSMEIQLFLERDDVTYCFSLKWCHSVADPQSTTVC